MADYFEEDDYMNRVQFYPSKELAERLNEEATKSGASVSKFVTELLENYYGLSKNPELTITQLTTKVLNEIELFLKENEEKGRVEFDLNMASGTYRQIDMTCGKKPSMVRASIGRSFVSKIGKPPFANVRKCLVNGTQKLSLNNALVYETFTTSNSSKDM